MENYHVLPSYQLFLSRLRLFATSWCAERQTSLSVNSPSLLKPIFIDSVTLSHHLILLSPPSAVGLSVTKVFAKESVLCIRWPKYWLIYFHSKALSLKGKHLVLTHDFKGFPDSSDGQEAACTAGDLGSIPVSLRSPGEGNSNPLQYPWPGEFHG